MRFEITNKYSINTIMDFKSVMTEWVTLKGQLLAARKDINVLNKREKDLRTFVTQHMSRNEISTVRVPDNGVKVNFKVKKSRGAITKDVVKEGLLRYFSGNVEQADLVWKIIQETAPIKEVTGVTLTTLKD